MVIPEKIEAIQKKCIEANPEIVELKFGCLLSSESGVEMFVKDLGDGSYLMVDSTSDYQPYTWHGKIIYSRILGRPIRLADVLLALQSRENEDTKFAMRLVVGGMGTLLAYSTGFNFPKSTSDWNLLKDDLSSQSEHTINFIFELLK